MASSANATFKINEWDEETIQEVGAGGKITRTRVTKSYDGDLIGEGIVEYLMAVKADGSASFVGYEFVTGELAERTGSFVFEHIGSFREGTVDSRWSVVDGSGTEELAGIQGSVEFKAGHQDEYSITLRYST